MHMAMVSTFQKVDAEHVADYLRSVGEKLGVSMSEAILDLSSVQRMDATSLRALGELADLAEVKGVTIVLRGVNVESYKVLKLVKLAPRFVFLT